MHFAMTERERIAAAVAEMVATFERYQVELESSKDVEVRVVCRDPESAEPATVH